MARRQLEEHRVTIEQLEKEKKDLTLRLSKLAGANLTYNNPNIADLSDESRPTKLAEDFSELYDNELTDAFESLDSENEKEKSLILLEILKKSYELCYATSQDHVNAVKNGFATLRIPYELEVVLEKSEEQASTDTEQVHLERSNKLAGEQSENKRIVGTDQKATEGANEESHVIQSAAAGGGQAEAAVTEKQPLTGNEEQHETRIPESRIQENSNAVTPPKTQETPEEEGKNEKECLYNSHDNVEDDEQKKKNNENVRKETRGVQSFPCKTLTAKFGRLTKEQMKTVSDIRKFFESELTEAFQKESAEIIAKSLSQDKQKNECVQYIHKCLQICWSMCRHEPPVFIPFTEQGTDTPFDTNVFRPYTKTGKYVDYVVWPPLYLYEGGPMLSKGIAQGRH